MERTRRAVAEETGLSAWDERAPGVLVVREPSAPRPMPDEPTEAAWIATYRETIGSFYAHVSRQAGGDRALAEDVTQEAWLKAIAVWRRRGWPRDPLAWLRTVAANLLRNHYRRLRPRPLGPGELDLEQESFAADTPHAAALLGWGLARLREGQARLLRAHHLEGREVRVMAAELGLSERAVEGRLRRAREALRRSLQPYVEVSGAAAPDEMARG